MPFLRERSGRWSPVKIAAFAATLLPALWIAYQAATDDLGARPVTEAIHQAGDWTLRFLLMTLAITPAQRILHYPPHHSGAAHARSRDGGLRAAASLALRPRPALRSVQGGERDRAARLSADRRAGVGGTDRAGVRPRRTAPSAVWARRAGTASHRLVYGIAVLGAVHFFIQSKLNIYQPVLMAGFLLWLLAYRLRLSGATAR